ncbi:hypothetical protein AAHE18_11G085900 [Arachis hypogaea]
MRALLLMMLLIMILLHFSIKWKQEYQGNSSALPFGDSILDITVITRMGEGYNLTVKELVKSIRVETLKFILS